MYQLYEYNGVVAGGFKYNHSSRIVFSFSDLANTDYQRFKTDVFEGAELQDADGNVMSADDAMAFISNLP